ncbi:OmpA family protein [Pseudomonas sp. MH2]|uniref:OmpA family protein n=1 Tax=Pseudomonas machongensis TaxID=3110229 RepID=A0ABU5VJZ2_9PSED|nr:OmpA family protein [Pseudomonas sp. MH2]MEA5673698.1 OmpA family protein [Pseudomonas sp. MH2]
MASENILALALVMASLSVMSGQSASKPSALHAGEKSRAATDVVEGGDHFLYFESDQATLSQDDLYDLQALGWQLAQNPGQRVCIRGHADQFDQYEPSVALSRARVQMVRYVLLKQGVQARQIATRAVGNRLPIETRPDERHQQVNRRVGVTWSEPGRGVACQ